MSKSQDKALSIFSPTRIFITILIGLGAASYMLIKNFDPEAFKTINWTWSTAFWILIALIMVGLRDLGYMYRLRVLTEGEISWRKCFDVIMLWEFASSITPSVVGGSGVAIYIINKEGINVGRSSAVVMVTALMDELFYIIMVPIVILTTGVSNLFPVEMQKEIFGIVLGTKGIFVVGYLFIIAMTSVITYAIFFQPRGFKFILLNIFRLPFLRRWRYAASQTGDDIIHTSVELKGKPFSFWAKAGTATFFSWTARFWVVNFLILAFVPVSEHLLIYARQLVMWVIMLISPTPGGTGIAELAFSGFLRDFVPLGLVDAMAILWRLLSYYPYLFIGAIILPRWLRRTHGTKKTSEAK